MPETNRKLAAIMFADMIGFTAIMQANEHLAHQMRKRQREVITWLHARHNGTVVQVYGDGSLSMFASAIDAVECAVAIQRELMTHPAVPLRIGIHMGEVIIDEDGIYGNSVNVAARIESLSVEGAVLLSGKVKEELDNHPEVVTVPIGEYKMKNVTNPIRVHAVQALGLPLPDAAMLYSPKASLVQSVAVLPFVNMSSDPEYEYFSDGITEELINALVRIDGLKVTARTSSFAFKGHNEDIRSLGKKLGVTSVLEGSVRKSGNNIRITAQLINTKDGFHLFSETWDRGFEDIFSLQDEIADEVAAMLSHKLDKAAAKSESEVTGTVDLDAYHAYLKARSAVQELSAKNLNAAIEYASRAIELQPDFGLAYSTLSYAITLRGAAGLAPSKESYERGRDLARQALALDPSIGQAYLSIAGAQMLNDWDFPGAQESLMKGLQISPGDVELHTAHSNLLSAVQRHDEAIDEALHAVHLDPLSITALRGYVMALMFARRYDESLDAFSMMPDSATGSTMVNELHGWVYAFVGDFESAREAFLKNREALRHSYRSEVGLGYVAGKQGDTQLAESILRKVFEQMTDSPNGLLLIDAACLCLGLGELDAAMWYLTTAAEMRIGMLLHLRNFPMFDTLAEHPGFIALTARIGLPPRVEADAAFRHPAVQV